jgi:hypothetical protein
MRWSKSPPRAEKKKEKKKEKKCRGMALVTPHDPWERSRAKKKK